MTVGELIAELEKYDKNYDVTYGCPADSIKVANEWADDKGNEAISTGGRMRLITKQVAKLEEFEARRERLVNRVAKLDLKIEEQKEKISQYYKKTRN